MYVGERCWWKMYVGEKFMLVKLFHWLMHVGENFHQHAALTNIFTQILCWWKPSEPNIWSLIKGTGSGGEVYDHLKCTILLRYTVMTESI